LKILRPVGERDDEMAKTQLEESNKWFEISALRYSCLFLLDSILIFIAFAIAYNLRFDGKIPSEELVTFWKLLPWLLSLRVVSNLASQIHRWSFRLAGFHDAIRFAVGISLGTLLFLSTVIFAQLPYPPRSVIALEFFISAVLLGGYRFAPRFLMFLYLERERSKRKVIRKTIIVGAGSTGELLLRDLRRSEEHNYKIVGFVDDDAGKIGKILSGHRILGSVDDIPLIVKRYGISDILIAIPKLNAQKVKLILDICKDLKLRYKVLPVSFAFLKDNVSASMLQDLQPEDLLPRESIPFEESEIRDLVRGRTGLVTGAAGSIGSEIARQLGKYGAKRIVLADINENDLYFLYRDLKDDFPETEVYAEVTDIRDRDRVIRLGQKYRPQDVLHAAAHKHVPLMETAPQEAVKNNIAGTINVTDMAIECGAEKFVFISTDKAVKPRSVMGVSKRIGEFIARDKGIGSNTHFSAVRFGNVLGSAGSVVPLFKKQIGKGGPVTVTHPEIKRYFMTVEEAVGLVLLAGLGKYGNLCILDMGEQIKILDLARHMISMAGLVPESDIPIIYTGLRPGEKLEEDLMTEEEEKTQKARAKIMTVKSSFLPAMLEEKLSEIKIAADEEDLYKIFKIFKELVPSFDSYKKEG
jgi:FlaA1/EpsC-like NDP-sugar epimerase